jgi:sugar phosphate isomerase/epimerase
MVVREGSPAFSISEVTTLGASFDDDLAAYREAGADGIGVWEMKLPDGDDGAAAERLRASGLASTNAVPRVPSILPLPLLPGPDDPRERVQAICGSLRRLAAFDPDCCVCLTGPAGGRDLRAARRDVVEGLRRIAEAADEAGVRVGLEPVNRVGGEDWTIATSIPEALELLEEAGDPPSLGIMFDVWHLWSTPTLLDDVAAHAGRFTGVHVSDWRSPTRGWADRVLPGEGVAGVPGILAALERAGWEGPYDLEIFSDDGTFGERYPDSLWSVPAGELARRGREAFLRVWEARKGASSTVMTSPHVGATTGGARE